MSKNKLFGIIVFGMIVLTIIYTTSESDESKIEKTNPTTIISATDLLVTFEKYGIDSLQHLHNKIIEVDGIVTEQHEHLITIHDNLNCLINPKQPLLDKKYVDKYVKIKGLFLGYDDLYNVLKMENCVIISSE